MKRIFSFILLLTACSTTPKMVNNTAGKEMPAQSPTSKPIPLNKDTTIMLWYTATGCTCAQWSEGKQQSDTADEQDHYYLEPANDKLINSDSLWDGQSFPLQIQVTGQIITYSGFPKDFYPEKEHPDPSNVFRYTKIKLIQQGTYYAKDK